MADYTKLTIHEVEVLLKAYDLGALASISPMQGGQANSSFKITTSSGRFILSVCDEKNIREIDCLTQILVHLKSNDFPSSRPVKTRNGNLFVTKGDKPVYVKKYVEGQVIKSLSPDMLVQVGKSLAALHALPPLSIMPANFPYGMDSFDEIIEMNMEHSYIGWLRGKKEFLQQSIDPGMAKGFIHGDIFWDNLLFSDEKLVAVLDFEEACHYYKLYDMGMCAVGCCGNGGRFGMDKLACLLKGYQQNSPLNPQERKQLKVFMEYAAVAGSFWRFRQYNIRYPRKHMADSHEELSSLADHIHGVAENEFMDIFAATE